MQKYLYSLILFIGFSGTSNFASATESVVETLSEPLEITYGYKDFSDTFAYSSDIKDAEVLKIFLSLTEEQRDVFFKKRKVILQALSQQIVSHKIKVGFFAFTKEKLKSSLRWATWSHVIQLMAGKEDLQYNQSRHERYVQLSQSVMQSMIEKADKTLLARADKVVSSQHWAMTFGAGLISVVGFRKATLGVGVVLGLEIAQTFSDLQIRVRRFRDVMVANNAIFPTLLVAAAGHFQLYLSDGSPREAQNRFEITYFPMGPSTIRNESSAGGGFSVGVPLLHIAGIAAYFGIDSPLIVTLIPFVSVAAYFKMAVERQNYTTEESIWSVFKDAFVSLKKIPSVFVQRNNFFQVGRCESLFFRN